MKEEKYIEFTTQNHKASLFLLFTVVLLTFFVMVIGFYVGDVVAIMEMNKSNVVAEILGTIGIPISTILLIYLCYTVYLELFSTMYVYEKIEFYLDKITVHYNYLIFNKTIDINLEEATSFEIEKRTITSTELNDNSKLIHKGVHSTGKIELKTEDSIYYIGKNILPTNINIIKKFYDNNKLESTLE